MFFSAQGRYIHIDMEGNMSPVNRSLTDRKSCRHSTPTYVARMDRFFNCSNDIQVRNCCFVGLFLVRSYQWVLFQAQNHGAHGCSCCTKSTYCSTLELQVVRLYGPTFVKRDETMLCTSRTLTDLNVSEQNPKKGQQQLARPKLPLIGLIEKPTQNRSEKWRHQRGIVWLSRWRWVSVSRNTVIDSALRTQDGFVLMFTGMILDCRSCAWN